jgi:transcription initiation factor TFIID subunit TAF12
MQGKLIIGMIALGALSPTPALAGETAKRQPCAKSEQPQTQQQRQQAQQQRSKAQDCRTTRNIPPVVDPTPWFLL